MLRQTHTYVTLPVSQSAFDEVKAKLKAAAYGHCFNQDETEIDMTGIAVVRARESNGAARTVRGFAPPGTPDCQIMEYHLCKNPDCNRIACTASAPGYADFCCVPCSIGAPHSSGCDTAIVAIRARLLKVGAVEKSQSEQAEKPNEAKT